MKKIYNSPQTIVVKIQQSLPLATSGVRGSDPYYIDYGGVDNNGIIIPEIKHHSVWDDEW